MSVGVFMGIHPSYRGDALDVAQDLIAAVNAALAPFGVPPYEDPPKHLDVYVHHRFGRSALDHHGAEAFEGLAGLATTRGVHAAHLALLTINPYRVAFLPSDFAAPVETDHTERIAGEQVRIWVGSSPRLLRELEDMAPLLGIALERGELPDRIADAINELEPLVEGEEPGLAEDARTAWLLLFEGARMSCKHGVALSLAG